MDVRILRRVVNQGAGRGKKSRHRRNQAGKSGSKPENKRQEEVENPDEAAKSKKEKAEEAWNKVKTGYGQLSSANEVGLAYDRLLAGLWERGASEQQIKHAQDYVFKNYIPGTSRLDRMSILADAQKTFNSGMSKEKSLQAAELMVPALSRYDVASKVIDDGYDASKDANRHAITSLVAAMDAYNNPQRITELADGVFKYTQGTNQTFDEKQTLAFLANKNLASRNQNIHSIFSALEPVISTLGGNETAEGLQKASDFINRRFSAMPKSAQAEIRLLGMDNGKGTGQLETLRNLQESDIAGYLQNLNTVYKAHGINSSAEIRRENKIIFGSAGAKVYNQIMDAMDKTQSGYDSARDIASVVNYPLSRGIIAEEEVNKAKQDLQLSAAKNTGIMPVFKKINEYKASATEYAANWADKHPTLDKIILGGAVAYHVPGVSSWVKNKALSAVNPLTRAVRYAGRLAVNVAKDKLPAVGRAALPYLGEIAIPIVADAAVPALAIAGLGFAGIEAYRATKAAINGKSYHQIVTQSQEIGELDRLKRRNWAINNPTTPYYGRYFDLNDLPPKSGVSPLSRFPDVPSAHQQPVQIQVNALLDGKKVGEGMVTFLTKEAAKPRSGVSGFDPNQLYIPPGSVSKLATN